MRKILALLLVLCVVLSLFGCDNDSDDDRDKSNDPDRDDGFSGLLDQFIGTTEYEFDVDLGKGAPSSDIVSADLYSLLETENPHASIHDLTLSKSLTNDASYECTFEIVAKTKYAQWNYTLLMYYTKYDQGWMLDDAYWESAECSLPALPSDAEADSIINQFLPEFDWIDASTSVDGSIYYDDTYTLEYYLAEQGYVYAFDISTPLLHGMLTTSYQAAIVYNSSEDYWELDDYRVTSSIKEPYDVDFSGKWDRMEIQNFSWYDMDVKWLDDWDSKWTSEFSHFYRLSSSPSFSTDDTNIWYSNGNGLYIYVYLSETSTTFTIYKPSGYSSIKVIGGQTITELLS